MGQPQTSNQTLKKIFKERFHNQFKINNRNPLDNVALLLSTISFLCPDLHLVQANTECLFIATCTALDRLSQKGPC